MRISLAYIRILYYFCSMKQLLDDYIFSDVLRYEGHCLIYGKEEDRLEIGGFLGAAVLGALLSGTDEGRERSIFLNIRDGRKEFFDRYEDETLHENGGFFSKEVQALSEAYMEINGDLSLLLSICGNDRLYDLAFGLMIDYMEKLVEEQVGEHIYDAFQWTTPFAQWLFTAGYVETRRQQLLAINWSDPAGVYSLAEFIKMPQEETEPTFVFDNERAEDLLNGYYNWLMAAIEQEAAVYPDEKVQLAALKEKVRKHEPDYDFLKPEMKSFTPEQINLFRNWMNRWTEFLNSKLKPEKQITFWTKSVTEEQQEALLDYLKIQEREPQRYKCLAVAVYSLRQLGYITYTISVPSIVQWLSKRLQNDYSSKTGIYQFRRAWNELRRYHPAVQDEVDHLAEMGVRAIK